ncbi:MAG: extracellular solute-binding protein, partial [Chloroflexi bacterium]|nr:extracellular solute-binding protein [Chloroflexota bacterium]
SPYEKETGEKMLASFTEKTGIKTTPMHIPDAYMEKMLAMAAANTLPDVFYLYYTNLVAWAQKGLIEDLTNLYGSDSEAKIENIVEVNRFKVGSKIFGTGACTEPMMMFYNKKVFDDAKLDYPPAKAEEAWTWDKFLEVARQLTVDESGKHPSDAGFDPTKITTFGVDIVRWGGDWRVFAPYMWSQGADIYSEDMNTLFPNLDVAINTIQKIADISAKEYVHPSPDFYTGSGMGTMQMLQTGKLAMQVTGNWALEEISHSEFPYGEAVAPKMGDKYFIFANSEAIGMKRSPKFLDAAWKLHKWVVFGEGSLALSRTGLWQPQRIDLLTTEEGRKTWMDPKVHTPEHVTAACLPAVNNARIIPPRLGQSEWQDKYLTPALEPVYLGKKSAEQAIKEVLPEINKFLKDNPNWP